MIFRQKAMLLSWLLTVISCSSLSEALLLCPLFPYFDSHEHAVCPIGASVPSWASNSLDSGWLKGDACHKLGSDQFCTFTHPGFNRGLGVSFVTRDAILKDVSSMLASEVVNAENGSIAAVPSYEAKQIPGKGVGLIANRNITQGELIMARTPAVVVDGTAFNNLSTIHLTQALAQAIKSLPQGHQKEYLRLSTHDDVATFEERVYKIFATNNFRTKFTNGNDFHSTFTEVSRLNHDCRPNSGYHFDASTLSQNVYAARDIRTGEELSIAYYDPLQARAARRHQLQSHWGFQCTCKHCTADPELVAKSDQRIEQIHALWRDLDDYSPASAGSAEKAELLVQLYQLEGVETRIHEAYYRAAIEWNGVGNSVLALEAAQRCLDRGELMRGPDAPFARNMRELIQNPQKHWSWNFRLPNKREPVS
ncbi:hypothetical protein N8I77_007543 [Diaporthe amygdali]|uniref:SET domain-containing protein n=1 Tax=Phomopsis amygdali TaxID=1214568 RepID=A0AAD9W471_PHOAM|nr:hypothetical protein N8I77_007543 [Diaporthe amygdali]